MKDGTMERAAAEQAAVQAHKAAEAERRDGGTAPEGAAGGPPEVREALEELKAVRAEAEALRARLEEYRAADEARERAAREAAEREALLRRVDAAAGGRRFLHPRLRELAADGFARALAEGAAGSDREILAAVTAGEDWFASRNPAVPRMAEPSPVRSADAAMASLRAAMGLADAGGR